MSIQEKHLEEIEGLIAQSMSGVHILFDNEQIARILNKPLTESELFSFDNMDQIQNLLTQLIERHSVLDKMDFIRSLPEDQFEILLRTYFHILESSVLASTIQKH